MVISPLFRIFAIMTFIDFHTHHRPMHGEHVIQDGISTRGRHPWYLTTSDENSEPVPTPTTEADAEKILAIGESGLDRLCHTPYPLQLQVFREEVKLSEQLRLPLFLHCVRAVDDVLRIRRELRAQQPWIWHGYRGHAPQLCQLLGCTPQPTDQKWQEKEEEESENYKTNFYFSFGVRYDTDALMACPPTRLLLETDDDTQHPIADHYAQVAQQLHIPLERLVSQMHANYHTLFGNLC